MWGEQGAPVLRAWARQARQPTRVGAGRYNADTPTVLLESATAQARPSPSLLPSLRMQQYPRLPRMRQIQY